MATLEAREGGRRTGPTVRASGPVPFRTAIAAAGRRGAQIWSPALVFDPARGPVLWTVLGICVACAALVVLALARSRATDPFVSAVLLATTTWTAALAASRGRWQRRMTASAPYFVALLALATLAVLQATGDPNDLRHTNALLGAYLAVPVAHLLFFLLRPPTEALVGAVLTCAAAVVLQAALPPAVVGRYSTGPWAAAFTAFWHVAVIMLLVAVPRLRSGRDLLHAVMRSSRDAVVLLVPDRRVFLAGPLSGASIARFSVVFANGAAERTFGIEPGEDLATGGPLGAAPELYERLAEAANTRQENTSNATLPTLDGLRWFRVTAAPFRGGVAATFVDITEHKETEVRALELARTDALTGVANRRGFELEAAKRLSEARRSGRPMTLCYLDLDGFKSVNDRYGHDAGDELLKGVAARLKAVVRASDLVARLGGDEFVILAGGLDGEAVSAFYGRVNRALSVPFEVADNVLDVRASLGVVTGARDLSAALARADAAMYRAKQGGGGLAVVPEVEEPVTA